MRRSSNWISSTSANRSPKDYIIPTPLNHVKYQNNLQKSPRDKSQQDKLKKLKDFISILSPPPSPKSPLSTELTPNIRSPCFDHNPFLMFLSGKYSSAQEKNPLVTLNRDVLQRVWSFHVREHAVHVNDEGVGLIRMLPKLFSKHSHDHVLHKVVELKYERFYYDYTLHNNPHVVFSSDSALFHNACECFFQPGWVEVHFPYHSVRVTGYTLRNGGGRRYALKRWKLEGKRCVSDSKWSLIHSPKEDYSMKVFSDSGLYFAMRNITVPHPHSTIHYSAFRLTNLDTDWLSPYSSRPLYLSKFDLFGFCREKDTDVHFSRFNY